MPSSLQARRMRSAISPRFAISTLSSIVKILAQQSGDGDQRLVVFDRLAVFDQDAFDNAGLVCFDLVHHLHRFNDADHITRLDALTYFNKGAGGGGRRAVECANHW